MRERDILYEVGDYWVTKTKAGYVVFRDGVTHATSQDGVAYSNDVDGLSVAKARADYLAKRAATK